MKKIAVFFVIALLLCVGCRENQKNADDGKSVVTGNSTGSEAVVTENITSETAGHKTVNVHTTLPPEKSSADKEYAVTEKSEENTETRITTVPRKTTTETYVTADEDITPSVTESATDYIPLDTAETEVTEITRESEITAVPETKPQVIELPFVPAG